jgi:hypothetical protein
MQPRSYRSSWLTLIMLLPSLIAMRSTLLNTLMMMNYWDSTLTIEDWDQQGVTHFNIDLDDVFDCDYADVVSMMEYIAHT